MVDGVNSTAASQPVFLVDSDLGLVDYLLGHRDTKLILYVFSFIFSVAGSRKLPQIHFTLPCIWLCCIASGSVNEAIALNVQF